MLKFLSSFLILTIILPHSLSKRFISSYSQFQEATPKGFGLHLIAAIDNSGAENNNLGTDNIFTGLQQSLTYYASMSCDIMTQIVVVVRRDLDFGSSQFKTSNILWTKSVLFLESEDANMFILHPDSKADVYFSMNSDAVISCEELTKSFEFWKKKSVGDIAPIITYNPRSFDFDTKTQSFPFNSVENMGNGYFNVALLNGAWISRFYFQLFASIRVPEAGFLVQHAKKMNNCFDIGLNFLISKLFPELQHIAIGGNFNKGKNQQKHENKLISVRTECLKTMSFALGHNPLRSVSKNEYENKKKFTSEILPFIIFIRRLQLQSMMGTQQKIDQSIREPSAEQNILREELSRQKAAVSELKKQLEKQKDNVKNNLTPTKQVPKQEKKQPENEKANSNSKQQKQIINGIGNYFQFSKYLLYGVLGALAFMVVGVVGYGCALCCQFQEDDLDEKQQVVVHKSKAKEQMNKYSNKIPSSQED